LTGNHDPVVRSKSGPCSRTPVEMPSSDCMHTVHANVTTTYYLVYESLFAAGWQAVLREAKDAVYDLDAHCKVKSSR
jgi:hypothetical protein